MKPSLLTLENNIATIAVHYSDTRPSVRVNIDSICWEGIKSWHWMPHNFIQTKDIRIQGFGIPSFDGTCFLSRYIMYLYGLLDMKYDGDIVHHKNEDPLDNTLQNLEITSNADNIRISRNTLRANGVGLHNGRWRARISVNNKSIFIGHFKSQEDAIKARLDYCKSNNIRIS